MSHRRWRQKVAPGVSPWINRQNNPQSSKKATEISAAPTGLASLFHCHYPGLTPGAIDMPPANSGSLRSFVSSSLLKRSLSLAQALGFLLIALLALASSKTPIGSTTSLEGLG